MDRTDNLIQELRQTWSTIVVDSIRPEVLHGGESAWFVSLPDIPGRLILSFSANLKRYRCGAGNAWRTTPDLAVGDALRAGPADRRAAWDAVAAP